MRLMRTAALTAIGKKLYDEARKPHNQAKIKRAVEQVKARRSGGSASGGTATHR